MSPFGIIKFIGAWACIVGSVVIIVLEHGAGTLAGELALLGVAFALAPTSA